MPLEIKRKEGESMNAFLFRFNKKIKQSGILKEVRKNRFTHRTTNRRKRRSSALYRLAKQRELGDLKKYGFLSQGKNR